MKEIKKSLKTVKLQDLKLYKDNPRHNTRSALMVAKSIEKFGYIVPIVCNKDLVILAGNTRYKALKHLNIEEIDVIVIEGLTPEEEREFVIADNRIGEYSTWNASAISRLTSNEDSEFLESIGMKSHKQMEKALEDLINGK